MAQGSYLVWCVGSPAWTAFGVVVAAGAVFSAGGVVHLGANRTSTAKPSACVTRPENIPSFHVPCCSPLTRRTPASAARSVVGRSKRSRRPAASRRTQLDPHQHSVAWDPFQSTAEVSCSKYESGPSLAVIVYLGMLFIPLEHPPPMPPRRGLTSVFTLAPPRRASAHLRHILSAFGSC